MDERDIRTERTTGVESDYDRNVDIRRTMIMGRDFDANGNRQILASVPMHKAIHWGPIFAGWTTAVVSSLLIGSLLLGLGFDRSYGVFGGLTAGEVGIGTGIAMLLGTFIGAYLTGYVSDLRAKAEGVMNGFMVGVLSILMPIVTATLGSFGVATTATAAASNTLPPSSNPAVVGNTVANNVANAVPNTVQHQVTNALTLAADNAWQVFLVGVLVLAVGALAGYLGRLSREKAIEAQARHDLNKATTY